MNAINFNGAFRVSGAHQIDKAKKVVNEEVQKSDIKIVDSFEYKASEISPNPSIWWITENNEKKDALLQATLKNNGITYYDGRDKH